LAWFGSSLTYFEQIPTRTAHLDALQVFDLRVELRPIMGRSLSCEKWKELLRNDCMTRDKLRELDNLGDPVLKLLYDNSLNPTVDAIVKNGLNGPESIIRCPYCSIADEFRAMAQRTEGWLQCETCGHNAMTLDPDFRCVCSKCKASQKCRSLAP
jgi:hypothetical protein